MTQKYLFEDYGLSKELAETIYWHFNRDKPIKTRFSSSNNYEWVGSIFDIGKEFSYVQIPLYQMSDTQYHELAKYFRNNIYLNYEGAGLSSSSFQGFRLHFAKMEDVEINEVLKLVDDTTARQYKHWEDVAWKDTLEQAIKDYERRR